MKIVPVAVLLAVAAGGLATGYLAYRRTAPVTAPAVADANEQSAIRTAPADAGTAPESAPESAPSLPPIPETVPRIVLADLSGQRHALRDGSGHPHLYNFWATWCEPCRREIPLLNTLQGAYAADHLQVVGVAVDFRAAVLEFLKAHPIDYALRVGENDGLEAAQQFGMELNLPFSVFADGQDRIIAVKIGELHREDAEAILGRMHALAQGRTTPDQARKDIAEALKTLALRRAAPATTENGVLSRP